MTSVLYDTVISPFYDRLVCIWPHWVHPNALTLGGGIACTWSLVAMHRGDWTAAFVCYTIYHMLDNMDGKQARRTGKTSRVGHVLDHAIDGSVGVAASVHAMTLALFHFPEMELLALRFGLRCCMYTMIVCHLAERASGKPTLGMRYFSADESFLLCSFSLGVRAVTGSPVVTLPSSLFIPLAAFTLACICKLFLSTLRPMWSEPMLGGIAFACALFLLPWPFPVLVYVPAMASLLFINGRSAAHSPAPPRRVVKKEA